MNPVLLIAVLWLAFAATHMGLSSQTLRPRLVGAVGDAPFLGLYSLVALAVFVPMVSVYFGHQHAGPHLWYLGSGPLVRALMWVGMVTALALVIGGLIRQSPASMAGGAMEARGMLRVTRHPLFMGFGVFGLVHLIGANVNAAELVFFAGFPLFAVAGCHHQDRRKQASLGEPYQRFCAETSLLPFGRGGLAGALREAWLPAVLALAAAVGLRWVHPAWFGGAP
jgi:uncharacterized membrane protein